MPPSWYRQEITGHSPPCWHYSPEAASRHQSTLWWALNTTAEMGHLPSARVPLGPSHTCVIFHRQCKSTCLLRGRKRTANQLELWKLPLLRAPVGRQGYTSIIKRNHTVYQPRSLFPMHHATKYSMQVDAVIAVHVPMCHMRKWVIKSLTQVVPQPSHQSLCSPLPTTVQSALWLFFKNIKSQIAKKNT